MLMPKQSTEIATMDALTGLSEVILTDALDNFARASKSDEWRGNMRLIIITSDVLNTAFEIIGEAYDYNWESDSCYGIPIGSIKMLVLTR